MELLSFLFALLPLLRAVEAQADPRGICPTMYIRNKPSNLLRLSGCRVIEGSLQISMIDKGTPAEYRNYTFPELKEITGYFLLFGVEGLQTLRNLFPNLSLIRGQEYLYDYGFIVNGMPDLIEIGLPSLTHINRGIFINNNPNLCYLDTVDWNFITNTENENVVQKNKPNSECPNKCPDGCPKRDGRELCWTNTECQRVPSSSTCGGCRSGLCTAGGECCSEQCLGGCSGPGPMDCDVCKRFENWNGDRIICMEHCEEDKYEYALRRCVSQAECSNITAYDARTRQPRRGKIVKGSERENCVLDCPPEYEVKWEGGVEVCAKCGGACLRVCKSTLIDSSESSKSLQGCTRIEGELKIQIRHYSANLMQDLTANLKMIEVIDENLVIINSPFLTSLEFLKGLKYIGGANSAFALEIKSNDNLRELFPNQTVTITNRKARVQFHYNPKLCPTVIWEFVDKSGINRPVDNKIDIGTTNGDKVPCSQLAIKLYEVHLQQNSVTLKWDNFRTKLREPAHLLNYEIYYKQSPSQNASIYQDRDVCGNDDWNVLDHPKLAFDGRIEDEPPFEEDRIITGLEYYTQYAFYVKTVVIPIPDVNVTDLNVGGISSICYITTLPWIPTPPLNLKLSSPTPTTIKLEWSPPRKPNGVIEKYEIYVRVEETNTDFQNQRDYCLGRQDPLPKKSTPAEKPFSFLTREPDCCSCSANPVQKSTRKSEAQKALQIKDVEDAIINAVFFPNPTLMTRVRRSTGPLSGGEDIEGSPSDSTSAESHPVFPTHLQPPNQPSLSHTMVLNRTILASTIRKTGDFELTLSDLKHFTRYTIGIKACRYNRTKETVNGCREKNSSVVADPNLCSEIVKETITTLFDASLDAIPVSSIQANVTGNKVTFSWAEPATPNGMVMSYKVNVTRLGSGQYPPQIACITRVEYDKSKYYSLESPLNPGNYSLQIQVLSLATYEANFTEAIYFEILSTGDGLSTSLLLAVLIPILLLVLMAVGIGVYVVRTRLEINKIISANPEYLQNVDIPAEWEVGPEQVKLKQKLGKGSFGEVYLGILHNFKNIAARDVAIKTVAENSSSEDRYRFLKEASIMTQMDCHHIVKLIAIVSLTRPTYVIMELMARGDLKEYLISRRPENGGEPPTLRQILRMAAGIADGMAYLDDHKFVHRDLAARNCMVAEDLTVKVGDFGMTKDVVETDYYRKETRGFLPVRWMAPESIREGKFTIQSDVWSFGIVLWEMATLAAQPYQGLDNEQSLRYVRDGGIMERPHNCPEVLHSMMTRCWASTPTARPTFADILDWLMPELDASFAQVSFIHSAAGLKYRENLHSRPSPTHPSRDDPRTPLRATFDSESDSDSDAPPDTHFLPNKPVPQIAITMDSGANNNASAGKVPNGVPRNGFLRNDRTTQC